MKTGLLHLHSFWAYLVVIMLFIAVINSLLGIMGKRNFGVRDLRISLFTLIVAHFQLLIGIVVFFLSGWVQWFNSDVEVSNIMKDSSLRLYNLEHPLMMIIGIILITIGFSKHKKAAASSGKFKSIFVFYTLALLLVMARIPWANWFTN